MASAAQITDRAKRYRAVKNVTGPMVCVLCGAKPEGARPLDVMHLSGNEADGETANLAYGCRSCNGILAAAFKRIGAGVPTNQYNPAKAAVPSYEQYAWAVSQQQHSGEHGEHGAIIHATPKSKRIEYARRIARKASGTKREKADERWNPAGPFYTAEHIRSGRISKKFTDRAEAQAYVDAENRKTGGGPLYSMRVGTYETSSSDWPRSSKRKGKRNPASASADVYEEFHGHKPREVVTVTKKVHTHAHLASAGTLKRLVVLGVDKQVHTVKGFKGALLAFNEEKNQLFVEGGDQSLNLEDFGIRKPHELETLGKVKVIDYHADKSHLGDEGGDATYTHQFRTTNENGAHVVVKIARYPDLIYDVRNEQLLFSGGSYTIRAEGIDV